jgi:hypothetical protein
VGVRIETKIWVLGCKTKFFFRKEERIASTNIFEKSRGGEE